MPHTIAIRNNTTGEIRLYQDDEDWFEYDPQDGQFWWWTDGNGGCDCNREIYFERAAAERAGNDCDDAPCGEGAYTVLYAEFPDGTRIEIDPPNQPNEGVTDV